MTHARTLLLLALVVLSALACAPVAEAQTRAELARSRTLFERGLAHAEAERWEEAREAFEQALAITERPSILLNLATAQAETGLLLESTHSYERFLEVATGRDQRANRESATRALEGVQRRLGHIELEISGLAAGDEVRVDEAVVPITAPVAVNPGEHRVVVRRGARDVRVERVTVAEGATETVTLRVPDLRPTRVVTTTEPDLTEPTPAASGGDDSLAIGLGVGLGVGALVIGAIVIGVVVGTSSPAAPYQGNVGDGVIRF